MEEQNNIVEPQKEKGKKGLIIGLIVIILILIAIITIVLLKPALNLVGNNNDQPKSSETNKQDDINTNEENTKEEIDFDTNEADKLLQKFGLSKNGGLWSTMYNIYEKGYDDELKLIMAINNVDSSKKETSLCSKIYLGKDYARYIENGYWDHYESKNMKGGNCNPSDELTVIKYSDVNKIHEEMFGTSAIKKPTEKHYCSYAYQIYDYNAEGKFYNSMKAEGGCGGTYGPNTFKVRSAKLNGNILTITVVYAIGSDNYTEADFDNVSNYIVTFKKDGNNYTFQKIEKK